MMTASSILGCSGRLAVRRFRVRVRSSSSSSSSSSMFSSSSSSLHDKKRKSCVRGAALPRPPCRGGAQVAAAARRFFSPSPPSAEAAEGSGVDVVFVEEDGEECQVKARVGQTLLELAHENDVQLEGACGGDLACSTCHVVLPKEYYDLLPPKQEEEEDMLDLAWGLTETSRLGCQIKVTKELQGMRVTIPADTLDLSK